MTINQNPFSVYDFLGYLVPGTLFTIGLFMVIQDPIIFSFDSAIKVNGYSEYFIILLICYLIGHLLSFISSVSIEKYSVWTLGYPSKYLFNKPKKRFWKSIFNKYERNHFIGSILRIIFRIIIKFVTSIIILPITLQDVVVRHFFRLFDQYARPFDEDLMNIIRDRINSLLREKYNVERTVSKAEDDQDYFRVIYHYAIENSPNHIVKMQNYVALYGFIRTTTLIFILLFWILVINYYLRGCLGVFWYIPSSIGIISFILYLDFNKFYRKFSVEAFMAATVNYKVVSKEEEF